MKKNSKKSSREKSLTRYAIVTTIAVFMGVLILGRLGYLIYMQGEYWGRVAKRFEAKNKIIEPTRGDILACDGQVLATSLPQYRLYMDFMDWDPDSIRRIRNQAWRDSIICADTLRVIPGLLNRKGEVIPESLQRQHIDSCRHALDQICEGMHEIFPEIDPVEFRAKLQRGRNVKHHSLSLYSRKVSYIQYRKVKELPLFREPQNKGGFYVQEIRSRQNPYGKLAARTVGDLFANLLTHDGRDTARCGLELYFDDILRGTAGSYHTQKTLNSYVPIVDKAPEDGLNVRTTLDINMQDIVEKALGDQLQEIGADFGICAIMEVATGDIKAISSLDRLGDGSYKEIANRAVSLLMEPGSVFKTVSFMVGLDEGKFTLSQRVDTYGGVYEMYHRKMKDSNWRKGGHGNISASEVLEMSSNIGTSKLIDQAYHAHPEKYVEAVYRTGIQEDLQLPLKGYAKPRIRMPKKDATGRYWANWSNTALPWMSIGYETQVPPISTLTFYNGIANGGKMLYPRFVKSIERDGEIVQEYPVRVLRQNMCKPTTIRDLQSALRNTVIKGTGKPCGSRHFGVSGKTGTAQIWDKGGNTSKYLVSFVGYFPSEAPKYTMIVCIKKSSPAYGGMHCGPVFKRVAETIMAQKREKDFHAARDTVNAHRPIVHPGNVVATQQTLNKLGMNNTNEAGNQQWGQAVNNGKDYSLRADGTARGLMPNLLGYGLRDAIYRMEKLGLKVHTRGYGRVIKQNIKPGDPIRPGMQVELTLSTDSKPLKDDDLPPQKPDSQAVATTSDSLTKSNQAEARP